MISIISTILKFIFKKYEELFKNTAILYFVVAIVFASMDFFMSTKSIVFKNVEECKSLHGEFYYNEKSEICIKDGNVIIKPWRKNG